MNKWKDWIQGKSARYILIAALVLLVTVSVGTFTVHLRNNLLMVQKSKPTMAAVDASGVTEPQQESVPVSGPPNAVSSELEPASSAPPAVQYAYQAMYPELHTDPVLPAAAVKNKTVYLTFDDGPSNLTIPLLDVLDKYHVKATFFVVGHTDPQSLEAMKEIVDRGHTIAMHSYTHQYNQIYGSPAAFLDDFAKLHDLILKTTGVDAKIYRYAGGSINSYNRDTARTIIEEMNRRGYVYYDWNVSSGDAEHGSTAKSIYRETINGVHRHNTSVVLFHNTAFKRNTLSQMPKIIETLQKEGYSFECLDSAVDNTPYRFRIPAK